MMFNEPRKINRFVPERAVLVKRGVWTGVCAGFVLACLYVCGLALVVGVSASRTNISGIVVLGILTLMYGGVIGVIPATILGGVTGGATGLLLHRQWRRLSRKGVHWYGVAVCSAVVLLLNTLLTALMLKWDGNFNPPVHLIFLGVPSLIYILAGAWVSRKLYEEAWTKW